MDRRSAVLIAGGGIGLVGVVAAWVAFRDAPSPPRPEVMPIPLPLAGGPERADAEISGMAWTGDRLVLLPQYPERFDDSVFVLERAAIERAIDGDTTPLTAARVPMVAPALEDELPGFDGYEAIAIDGDEVYVAVETRQTGGASSGYILYGRIEGDLDRIAIDPTRRAELPAQNQLENTGYEALVVYHDEVLALYETNGEVNLSPRVLSFDRELARGRERVLTPVEYRITDATDADERGRFWVVNYHWPGAPWQSGTCSLTERYGQGATHARCRTVERLVELQIEDGAVTPTVRPPILMTLVDDDHARNWEGVVRLGARGFLIMTDEHPSSIMAFVPSP